MKNIQTLPPVLQRFKVWVLWSTALSAVYTACLIAFVSNPFGLGILVLWDDGFWWDLWVFQARYAYFHTPHFWDAFRYPFTYPAAMGVVFAVLYKIPHLVKLYLLACTLGTVAWAWVLAQELTVRGVARKAALGFAFTVAATAWPVWALLTSANTEGIVAVIVAGGVWSVMCRRYWIAATLLAIAGAMKIFPLVLLALLLSRKRYKEFAYALVLAAAINVASLAILGPTIAEAQRHITAGLVFVKYSYALECSHYTPDVSHSLFAPIKFVIAIGDHVLHRATWKSRQVWLLNIAYTVYFPLAIASGAALYFTKIRTMPMLNQVLALIICAVWLPPYSVDYTLLHLMLPFALLCVLATEAWRDAIEVQGMRACMICFAFIFPIGTFFTLKYRFGSLVRCFALGALLMVVLRFPFRWRMFDEPEVVA